MSDPWAMTVCSTTMHNPITALLVLPMHMSRSDREGIATRLTINDDGTYVLWTQYLDKSEELFV